ncbi:MAG: threonine--tRNA ligase [Peptoniphilaceae bacterium]|nr:threonine--tRNA ligase [Peptoniphilaceae bacterium]MDY3075850.1 threonine--tRNA ligase [Peptoniphilaceae bacterium]
MKVFTKGGSPIELSEGANALDFAGAISEGLARNALAAEVNGEGVDLRHVLKEGDVVAIDTFDDDYGRHAFRHSSAHLMAEAVQHLYPEAKFAIGPAIKDGFYYDIDFGDIVITDEDLPKIEEEMKKIVSKKPQVEYFTMDRASAIAYFKEKKQPYKVELIEDLPEDAELGFYKQEDFTDLCAGPHVMNLGVIKAFKLTSLAGAYWRGDEHNKMLTRIYGTSFPKKKLLDEHLLRIEEAKKRDHRRIGREMGIFEFMEEGPGFPFFLPNGMRLKNALLDFWRELHREAGYEEISTPMILNRQLWETSGHWDHYRENMYTTKIDGEDYAIKPMNCPGAMLVYKSRPHSYRELPLRLAEVGCVHRHELSGALHGLFRVRCFHQDDAHIFLAPDMIEEEIRRIVTMIDKVYTKFGFRYFIELSTRPEDSMGSDEDWNNAIASLKKALEDMGRDYIINEGDGAFYGPKIDFHLEDALGRTWQCGTIQLDFQMPQRFELEYVGSDGEKHRPVLIHRVIYGAIERFIGILIEQYAGNFPIWLAPVQVKLIPVNLEAHGDAAKKMARELEAIGAHVELDLRNETLGRKIRDAQIEKTTFQIVVGDQEVAENTVSVRRHGQQKTETIPFDEFRRWLKEQIETRADEA